MEFNLQDSTAAVIGLGPTSLGQQFPLEEFVSIAVREYLAGPRTQSARQSPIEEGQTNLSV